MKNTKMSFQTLEEIVSGFWEFRVMQQDGKTSLPLDELLFKYLLTRNQSDESAAVEEGYSLQDAWRRYSHDPYIQLFTHIMMGEVGVEVIDKWNSSQASLMETFKKSSPTEVTMQPMAQHQSSL